MLRGAARYYTRLASRRVIALTHRPVHARSGAHTKATLKMMQDLGTSSLALIARGITVLIQPAIAPPHSGPLLLAKSGGQRTRSCSAPHLVLNGDGNLLNRLRPYLSSGREFALLPNLRTIFVKQNWCRQKCQAQKCQKRCCPRYSHGAVPTRSVNDVME